MTIRSLLLSEMRPMNDYESALDDIAALRDHATRTAQFKDYGPLALALTAANFLVFGLAQPYVVPYPLEHPAVYVGYWVIAEIFAITFLGLEAARRARRASGRFIEKAMSQALRLFMPTSLASASTTLVLLAYFPIAAPLFPGLWQILLGLGAFAAAPMRRRILTIMGFFYLATGALCLTQAASPNVLSPWSMAGPLVLGQTLAAILILLENRSLCARQAE